MPAPTSVLSSSLQLATLSDINAALHAEYALRRRMLVERVQVTLASFLCRWSRVLKLSPTPPRLGEEGRRPCLLATCFPLGSILVFRLEGLLPMKRHVKP